MEPVAREREPCLLWFLLKSRLPLPPAPGKTASTEEPPGLWHQTWPVSCPNPGTTLGSLRLWGGDVGAAHFLTVVWLNLQHHAWTEGAEAGQGTSSSCSWQAPWEWKADSEEKQERAASHTGTRECSSGLCAKDLAGWRVGQTVTREIGHSLLSVLQKQRLGITWQTLAAVSLGWGVERARRCGGLGVWMPGPHLGKSSRVSFIHQSLLG